MLNVVIPTLEKPAVRGHVALKNAYLISNIEGNLTFLYQGTEYQLPVDTKEEI